MAPVPDESKRELMGQLLAEHLHVTHPEISPKRQREIVRDVSNRLEALWNQVGDELECKYVAFYILALAHADLLCRLTDDVLGGLLAERLGDLIKNHLDINKN